MNKALSGPPEVIFLKRRSNAILNIGGRLQPDTRAVTEVCQVGLHRVLYFRKSTQWPKFDGGSSHGKGPVQCFAVSQIGAPARLRPGVSWPLCPPPLSLVLSSLVLSSLVLPSLVLPSLGLMNVCNFRKRTQGNREHVNWACYVSCVYHS